MQKPYDVPLNIGVVAGPSRIIHVDCDQASEVEAFQNDWATSTGDPGYLAFSPTVLTPGAFRNGEWKHSAGGHFYFNVPDDFDWTTYRSSKLKAPGGYDVRWGMQMSVVPPSVREEGPYRSLGDVQDAPQFLLDLITAKEAVTQANAARLAEYIAEGRVDANIAKWSVATPWVDLLVEDDWTDTSKIDKCGCPIFEKPGGGSSTYKSATAHENICEQYPNVEGHGPLHLWTTDPPPPLDEYLVEHGATITKLSYVALTRYDGDVERAKDDLGITVIVDFDAWNLPTVTSLTKSPSEPSESSETAPLTTLTNPGPLVSGNPSENPSETQNPRSDDPSVSDDTPSETRFSDDAWLDPEEAPVADDAAPSEKPNPQQFMDQSAAKYGVPEALMADLHKEVQRAIVRRAATDAAEEYARALAGGTASSIVDRIKNFSALFDARPTSVITPPDILMRTDGKGLFHKGRTNYIVGRRGAGKTWLADLGVAQVLWAGGRVIYFDLEDSLDAFVERLTLLGVDVVAAIHEGRLVWMDEFPSSSADPVIESVIELAGDFDLAVFDVINRMIHRLGGDVNNGNAEVLWLTDYLFDPVARRGAGVVILDHPNRKGSDRDADPKNIESGGGAMKGNNASGTMASMKVLKPFTRDDPTGEVELWCSKNRTGFFAEGECIGVLRSDLDMNEVTGTLGLTLRIDPPSAPKTTEETIQDEAAAVKRKLLSVARGLGASPRRRAR